MSDSGDLQDSLRASARGLVRELAGKLDLEGMKSALADIEAAAAGERLEAFVMSAVPLTKEERGRLESGLRDALGRDADVSYRVEPAILGGLVVRVGDRYVDGSVAARLGQLRHRLVGTR